MGGICEHPSEKNILYTTKSLPDSCSTMSSLRFYFSTEPLSKLDAQCLLIISNDAYNLRKNPFIDRMMKKNCADKICSDYKAFIKGKKIQAKQFFVFSISVNGLDFTKICILYFPQRQIQQIYQQNSASVIEQKFVGTLHKCITYIKQINVRSLVITEFTGDSWIHKNNGFKQIAKILIKASHFKAVVFASLSEQSQSLSMKAVQQIKKQLEQPQ